MPCKSLSKEFWNKKTKEILSGAHMSPAEKILAYKIFLRPILLFNWFQGRRHKRALEIQALEHIFPGPNVRNLYSCYTDIDVNKYLKVEEIRWKRASGTGTREMRRCLRGAPKTARDPAQYFTRAIKQSKSNNCERRSAGNSVNTTNTSAETLTLRRSSRLADKQKQEREKL